MNKLFDTDGVFDNHVDVKSVLAIGEESGSHPLVSVVMPIYNHPSFFEESLLSVINQKGDVDYEIIIIDNNHPEYQKENQKIVERNYVDRIRYYVNESNIGGVGSENRGISLAKGKYVTFCHDDDLLFEDALQTLIGAQQKIGKEGVAIFGNIMTIDENGAQLSRYDEFDSFPLCCRPLYRVSVSDFLYRNYTNGCGSLFFRDNLINAGGYREDYIPCPDYALNAAYTYKYGSYALKAKTLKYRMSPLSDTSKVFNTLRNAEQKIIENILSGHCAHKSLARFFVKAHLNVVEYHLKNTWGEKKICGLNYIISRCINRMRIYASNISKFFRSK